MKTLRILTHAMGKLLVVDTFACDQSGSGGRRTDGSRNGGGTANLVIRTARTNKSIALKHEV